MKKLIFPAIAVSLFFITVSCDNNSDYETITDVNKIAIDSAKVVNDTMQLGAIQSIITYSKYTSGCEGFYAYDYQRDDMDRYVTTYKYKTDGTCQTDTFSRGSKINFEPRETGTYVFKFWQGTNSANQDVWLEKNIVVE